MPTLKSGQPCPEGKVLNPKTKRCVKIAGKIATQSQCEDYKKQINQLHADYDKLKFVLDRLEGKHNKCIVDLHNCTRESQIYMHKLKNAKSSFADFVKLVNRLRVEHAQIKHDYEQATYALQDLDSLQSRLDNALLGIKSFKDEIKALKTEKQANSIELKTLKESLKAVTREAAELKRYLNAVTKPKAARLKNLRARHNDAT